MAKMNRLTRRQFTRAAGRTALLGAAATLFPAPFVKGADPIVINHWSWLSASDGEVWQKMIDSFNDAHKDKGVQIIGVCTSNSGQEKMEEVVKERGIILPIDGRLSEAVRMNSAISAEFSI